MKGMPKKEKPLEKHSIILKFEHLNPALQEMIGEKPRIKDLLLNPPTSEVAKNWVEFIKNKLGLEKVMASPRSDTIRRLRSLRAFFEGGSLIALLLMANAIKSKEMSSSKLFGGGAAYIAACRTLVAKSIQWKHRDLVKSMKNYGILRAGRIESKYPDGWINPAIVARTHPVFYVKRNGDLIFPKMTRTEYARYVFQKRWPGKIGLNPWRWRAYLEPPEASQIVKNWAAEKAAEWAAAIRRPKLKPAMGLTTVRARKRLLAKGKKPPLAKGKKPPRRRL